MQGARAGAPRHSRHPQCLPVPVPSPAGMLDTALPYNARPQLSCRAHGLCTNTCPTRTQKQHDGHSNVLPVQGCTRFCTRATCPYTTVGWWSTLVSVLCWHDHGAVCCCLFRHNKLAGRWQTNVAYFARRLLSRRYGTATAQLRRKHAVKRHRCYALALPGRPLRPSARSSGARKPPQDGPPAPPNSTLPSPPSPTSHSSSTPTPPSHHPCCAHAASPSSCCLAGCSCCRHARLPCSCR